MAQRFFLFALIALYPMIAVAQTPLPLNEVVDGTVAEGTEGTNYVFTAESPGILTVAVRTPGGASDLFLAIAPSDAGMIDEAILSGSDGDFQGDGSAEQVACPIPQAGDYIVRVGAYDTPAQFRMIANFVPFEDAAMTLAAVTPMETQSLELGTPIVTQNSGSGPQGFAVSVTEPGLLAVIARGEGDITLTITVDGENVAMIDTDLGGNGANESTIIDIDQPCEVIIQVEAYEASRYVLVAEHKASDTALRDLLGEASSDEPEAASPSPGALFGGKASNPSRDE